MPRLSDTMEDGVVSAWLKQVGDKVTRGEVLAEIETDKALMELEAYDDGILEQIIAEPGARIPIGELIAIVGDGTGTAAQAAAQPTTAPTTTAVETTTPATALPPRETNEASNKSGSTTTTSVQQSGDRKKSSPLARKIAREIGVDITAVIGTGPGGRITRHDVEAAHRNAETPHTFGASSEVAGSAAAVTSTPATAGPVSGDYEEVPLTSIQRVSATRLTESKQQAPHIYLTSAIDVTDLFAFRTQINQSLEAAGEGKVSINDLLVKAVATTLRRDPSVNVSFAGDKLLRHNGIHLGIAVATPAGLLVPVIRDADRKSVSEIAADSRDKAVRARDRKLRADEMSGGTFTISNLGMFGIEQFTAVINPPESAILAVGAAREELRLNEDHVTARQVLRVTLSADHRAIDGAVAAQFLSQLKELLEHPLRIVT
ncbi:dihydrolipoamide acetyltransferase family protein [Nocardia sp. CA-107356]|uniref:dihydrolipoamide acetyltransferase family protein n=1 Tax=Nocardia sp. CA-107356 TaxID=3239972 RepID=UPI003D9116D8